MAKSFISAFHSDGWRQALQATYGYSFVDARWEAGEKAVAFGGVKSWLTGRRLVSLPFADHCEPLVSGCEGAMALAEWIRREYVRGKWSYIEIRPLDSARFAGTVLAPSRSFWLHWLDLEPSAEDLFRSLKRDNLQRRIRHAERQGLLYQRGATPELLEVFYRLLLKTRRRQGLLPQPRRWFENLFKFMGGAVEIRLASQGANPVGALFTLRCEGTVVYKYGCSDERFHHLGAMPFLFWKLIEESKREGAERIDFGRTDLDHTGLIAFKDNFGGRRQRLTYFRYPAEAATASSAYDGMGLARRVFRVLPDAAAAALGGFAYRHFG